MKQGKWLFLGLIVPLTVLTGCEEKPKEEILTNTRSIEHSLGVTQVPQTPKRVVTLDTSALDSAIAVGVIPVGTTVFEDFSSYLSDSTTETIVTVGEGNQPNLEAIVNLNPDLILGTDISSKRIYGQVSQIAPTVLSEGSGRLGKWQKNFQLFAEALGKSEIATQKLAGYQQRVTQLKEELEKEWGDLSAIEVSVVVTAQGKFGFYSANSFSGAILQDLGFSRPSHQERLQRWATLVSREKIEQLDGDMIFLIHQSNVTALINDPLISQLNAVQRDRVYPVSAEVWTAGRSILAAQAVLDDIAEALKQTP